MFDRLPIAAALLCACLVPVPPAFAARQGDDGLTREEIEQGWIRLFDGESTFGWTVEADDPGRAVSIADGVLTLVGPASIRTTTEFATFELRLRFDPAEGESELLLVRPPGEPLIPIRLDQIGPPADPGVPGPGGDGAWSTLTLRVADGRAETTLHREQRRSEAGSSTERRLNAKATGPIPGGPDRASVGFRVGPGGRLALRDIALTPLGMEPIFNGEDLSGWNVLDGGESVYSVTDEGYLNVKNGRGDLQTEGQYDDFVLQLDVFSNGEHLNSGIFFRAIPGQFWSGYESQIRNEYEGDDRTKPVDFGTGTIYRRQAARKVVADDFEWFTKTIVAHDNHFAVWVNGYQVTDWTDDREPADNGRNGYKAAPGVISIQGHDPTTDLSFRNLRIAELPGD